MNELQELIKELTDLLKPISDGKDSDYYIFKGEISVLNADKLMRCIIKTEPKRKNCTLFLTTQGGDADSAYRMVRAIRRYYEHFTLYVLGWCKSAGTLVALGANKIIMGDYGEFGPLDVQLTKKDDLMYRDSGLNFLKSLYTLNQHMFNHFDDNFMNILKRGGGSITTQTAAEISSKLCIGLIAPISSQIDPVKLGEVDRQMKVAEKYGKMLCSDNDLIDSLIADYPSHSFVIDYESAKDKFKSVSFVDANEKEIENSKFFRHIFRFPFDPEFVSYICSSELPPPPPPVDTTLEPSENNPTEIIPEELTNLETNLSQNGN